MFSRRTHSLVRTTCCVLISVTVGLCECQGDPVREYSEVFFIATYGSIDVYNDALTSERAIRLAGMTHTYGVRAATLTPSGEYLFLGVSHWERVLIAIDADTLDEIDVTDIIFPSQKRPFISHAPLGISVPTNRYLYLADESWTPEPDPYSTVIVDLEQRKVRRTNNLVFPETDRHLISPDGETMVNLYGDVLQYVDITTGNVRFTVNDNPVHYPAFAIDIDWGKQTADLTLQWNPSTKTTEYSVLHVDLATGHATREPIAPPEEVALLDHDTKLGRILLAYHEAQGGQRGNFPLVTPHLRALLLKLSENLVALVPEPFDEIYVSPGLRHLFVCKYEQSDRSIDDSEFISTLTVIDMKANSVVRTLELPYQLESMLFR